MTLQAARQGQPAEGVTLIETALAGTRGRASPALLAELHIRRALACATLRDTSACTAAISQARTHVEQLKPDDDPSWLYWLDPASIAVSAGNCLLQLPRTFNAVRKAALWVHGNGRWAERGCARPDPLLLLSSTVLRIHAVHPAQVRIAPAAPAPNARCSWDAA
ncbi:MAG: hypothetical protein ACT4NY_11895 [Pseudonocardiales bacterium]